uniref:Secreted protein n=1 Tax=Panagrellus redivivus TaxID=6233 RepID=A0A7E4V5A3_PANRE
MCSYAVIILAIETSLPGRQYNTLIWPGLIHPSVGCCCEISKYSGAFAVQNPRKSIISEICGRPCAFRSFGLVVPFQGASSPRAVFTFPQ